MKWARRAAGRSALTIKVVRLAHGRGLPLPAYQSAGAAGMASDRLHVFPDSETAAVAIPEQISQGDVVLLKGSRGIQLEVVANAIVERFNKC